MTHTRTADQGPTAPATAPETIGAADDVTRRDLLRTAGVTSGAILGGAALAACTQGQPENTGGGAGGEGGVVVALADIPVGGAVSATIDGQAVLVTQPAEGEIHAFSAICTHQGCTVTPGDGDLACPCHGSRYALTDAAVLAGPAPAPLAEVPVTVDGDDVVTAS